MFGPDPFHVLASSKRAPRPQPLGEVSRRQAVELLGSETVGRVAFVTPDGPRIVPVNFVLHGGDVEGREVLEVRTTSGSELAVHAPGTQVAFEVDRLEDGLRSGWSVVASGLCERDLHSFGDTTRLSDPQATPWAAGRRPMVLRVLVERLTARTVGPDVPRR